MKAYTLSLVGALVLTASVALASQDNIVQLLVPNKNIKVLISMSEIRANLTNYRFGRVIHLQVWTAFKTKQQSDQFKQLLAQRYYGGGFTRNNADFQSIVYTYEFMFGALFGKTVYMTGYDKRGRVIADGEYGEMFEMQNGPYAPIIKQIRILFEKADREE